jgi:shikimate kinase
MRWPCRIPRSSRILDRLAQRRRQRIGRVKADKIYLVGFMGAGKSSVAQALGKRLDWKVEDIDSRIERAERRDIPTIFRDAGEPYFRAREREALIALLPERGAVVASGGGTFADASNRELMLRDGAVIWLDAPSKPCCNGAPGRPRPLAADRLGMEQLYNQRSRPTSKRTSGWTQDAALWKSSSITSWSGWKPEHSAIECNRRCVISLSAIFTPISKPSRRSWPKPSR